MTQTTMLSLLSGSERHISRRNGLKLVAAAMATSLLPHTSRTEAFQRVITVPAP
jgi:hypothetical protein